VSRALRLTKAWKSGGSAGDSLLQHIGANSIRGHARELECEVKRVQEDVGEL